MVRLFKVYYPMRTLLLLAGEALIATVSFIVGTLIPTSDATLSLRLSNELFIEGGLVKIIGITAVVLLLSHGADLYDSGRLSNSWDQAFRLLAVLGVLAFFLATIDSVYNRWLPGRVFIPGAAWGLIVLTFMLLGWRMAHSWLVQQPFFRERVYVLGTGVRAERLLAGFRQRSEFGIEVVGWTGNLEGMVTREAAGNHLVDLVKESGVRRVIVAMQDRRERLPMEDLLKLRLDGVKVEEATSWLERIYGRIEVENLNPSWLIFAEGFRFSSFSRAMNRFLNFSVALTAGICSLPLLPFIWLAIKLDSPGAVLYHQKRVGLGEKEFYCHKFRTMRVDAEADSGATWALDNDPRITRVGRILRTLRLDEIPQLWCVLKGDMNFVGPRPERPEFVKFLGERIRFYRNRHSVRPGITGWAQVQYKYGNTLEDAQEKLQYDLFYIKNASIGLDFWIMFQTIKIVLLGRGAQ